MKIQILESYKPYLLEGTVYPVIDQDEEKLVIIDSKKLTHFISKIGGIPYKVVGQGAGSVAQ